MRAAGITPSVPCMVGFLDRAGMIQVLVESLRSGANAAASSLDCSRFLTRERPRGSHPTQQVWPSAGGPWDRHGRVLAAARVGRRLRGLDASVTEANVPATMHNALSASPNVRVDLVGGWIWFRWTRIAVTSPSVESHESAGGPVAAVHSYSSRPGHAAACDGDRGEMRVLGGLRSW